MRAYIGAVERFARFFGKPPDQLGPDHIRQYQAHLLDGRKLAVGTVVAQTAGLRFFFVRALRRRFPPDSIPYPFLFLVAIRPTQASWRHSAISFSSMAPARITFQ